MRIALDKGCVVGNLYNFGVFNFATSAPTTTGNALVDFVTGQVSTMEQDTPYHYADERVALPRFSCRTTIGSLPRFTVNLGVRWDIEYGAGRVAESDRDVCSRTSVHRWFLRRRWACCSPATRESRAAS